MSEYSPEGIEKGYIKLYRKIESGELASHGDDILLLAIRLLLRASHKESFFEGKKINPGELAISQKKFAKETQVARSTLNRRLKVLERIGFIKKHVEPSFTKITIINWTTYQIHQTGDGIINSTNELYNLRTIDEQDMNIAKNGTTKTDDFKNNNNDLEDTENTTWSPSGHHVDTLWDQNGHIQECKECNNVRNNNINAKIFFDYKSREFKNIQKSDIDFWKKTHPSINVENEILRAASWLDTKNDYRKKGTKAFINKWLSNADKWNPQKSNYDPYEDFLRDYEDNNDESFKA